MRYCVCLLFHREGLSIAILCLLVVPQGGVEHCDIVFVVPQGGVEHCDIVFVVPQGGGLSIAILCLLVVPQGGVRTISVCLQITYCLFFLFLGLVFTDLNYIQVIF